MEFHNKHTNNLVFNIINMNIDIPFFKNSVYLTT